MIRLSTRSLAVRANRLRCAPAVPRRRQAALDAIFSLGLLVAALAGCADADDAVGAIEPDVEGEDVVAFVRCDLSILLCPNQCRTIRGPNAALVAQARGECLARCEEMRADCVP